MTDKQPKKEKCAMSYEDFIHYLSCLKEGCLNLTRKDAEAFWDLLRELNEWDMLSDTLDEVEGL
jgi:hypothetical protein